MIVIPFLEFAEFAGDEPARWRVICGGQLVHKTLGAGTIGEAEISGTVKRLTVVFENDGASSTKVFVIPTLIEQRLVEDILISDPTEEQEALGRRLEKIRRGRARFQHLVEKMALPKGRVQYTGRLLRILENIDSGKELSEGDVDWLKSDAARAPVVRLAADHSLRKFREVGDPWLLARVSSLFRAAGRPREAVRATADFNAASYPPDAAAAVLTSRAAALADLSQLQKAWDCALAALRLNSGSAHTCNLLGRLAYIRGLPKDGDAYFAKAAELSEGRMSTDRARREALEQAEAGVRDQLARYLLEKDGQRYAWARRYLLGAAV